MNEFEINVDIKLNKLVSPIIELVQNDYNSTKFKFSFTGDDNYIKVFQLQLPDGSMWIKDIVNNEVVLVDEKDDKIVPVLVQSGKYIFDIAVYSDNAKLTTTNQESFFVRSELAGQDTELDDRLPILDRLINETKQVVNEADNLDIDIENSVVTIIKKDGTVKSENVKGDTYTITDKDLEEVEMNVKTDIQPILENIENVANNAENIAKGKSSSVVTDTWSEMEEWLKNVANKGTHKVGDNLYIKAKYTDDTMTERQPDYWIAEVLETPNDKGYYYEISELEADKPDLTAYAKKEQFVTLTQAEYETLSKTGTVEREDGTILIFSANTYYFIIEEE